MSKLKCDKCDSDYSDYYFKNKETGEIICEQCLLELDEVDTDTQTLYYLNGEYIGDDNEIDEVEEQICDYYDYEEIRKENKDE